MLSNLESCSFQLLGLMTRAATLRTSARRRVGQIRMGGGGERESEATRKSAKLPRIHKPWILDSSSTFFTGRKRTSTEGKPCGQREKGVKTAIFVDAPYGRPLTKTCKFWGSTSFWKVEGHFDLRPGPVLMLAIFRL